MRSDRLSPHPNWRRDWTPHRHHHQQQPAQAEHGEGLSASLPGQGRSQASLGDYIGLGKLIEASVRFAAYTKSDKVIAWKKRLIDETIKAQEPDGYLGIMAGSDRLVRLWDASDMGYIILGLTTDYQCFGEKKSLEAAKQLANYFCGDGPRRPINGRNSG